MEQSHKWTPGMRDTVVDILDRVVQASPDRTFLEFSGTTHSYGDVDRDSTRLAHSLAALGVKAGETVVTLLDNNIDAIVAWYAINKLCAVWVPVNTAYKGEFLRHVLEDAGATLVICEHDYAPRIAAIADGLSTVKIALYRNTLDEPIESAVPMRPLDDYRGNDDSPLTVKPKPADLAMLIYTGGTTGPSKGCMISHNYCCNQAYQTIDTSQRTPDEVHYTSLPMFHFNAVSTAVVASALIGAQVSVGQRFSVSKFWPEIERTGANIVSILGSMPAMIAYAADNESMKRCFGQLRIVRGSPFPAEIQEIFHKRFGVKVVGSGVYGLTEATMITTLSVDEPAKPGSSGKRNEDYDVRIFDDEGNEVPDGTSGEIVVRPRRPDIIFGGYWRRPEDTLKIMKDMWLHTGDVGKFDEDGYFYFVDRKKDYLRRRGENISSYEMETTFRQHPDIEDVAVHAVFSEVGEDDLKVTCVLREGASVTEEELCRWSIERVPYFAVPRYIEFRAQLPRSPVGRILKYQLRDEGKTAATWDREVADLELVKR